MLQWQRSLPRGHHPPMAMEVVAEVVTEVEIGVEITEMVEALIDTLMEEAVHVLTENFGSI